MSKKVHMKERLYSLRHFEKKILIEPYSKFGSKNWIGFFYATQRIELISLIWLTELTFFFVWLSELNFFKYDSVKWTFFFSNMTQRIEFLTKRLKELNFFFLKTDISQRTDFSMTQRIEFFSMQRIEPFFFSVNMTQRIEPFSIGLKDLMLFILTQRIELFLTRTDRIGPFSWIWLRELKFFLGFFTCLFFSKMMQRIEPFFEYDAKNWTLFLFEAKKRTFISLIWMTPRIVFSNKKYSMNWTFWNMTQRIEHLNHVSKKNSESGTLLKWFFWNDS